MRTNILLVPLGILYCKLFTLEPALELGINTLLSRELHQKTLCVARLSKYHNCNVVGAAWDIKLKRLESFFVGGNLADLKS